MLRVDHTKYSDDSEAMIGIMLIGLDLAFLVGSVLTFFIAAFVLRRRIIHIHRIKSKMRTLARTATTLDFGERNDAAAAATSRELAEWKIPENQKTPEEKEDVILKNVSMKSTKVIPILITLLILPTLIVAAPSKPSSAEIYIHEEVSVQVKQAPLCRILQSLTNAENSGKTTYGQDMRACFDPSGFNKAPYYQKWKATVGSVSESQKVTISGSNDGAAKNLQACIGECDNDGQCASGLKCFQRQEGENIPGCKGLGGDGDGGKDWDYCYDPNLLDFIAIPSGDDRPYLSEDAKDENGAKMKQPFVKGSTLSKISFGTIKGSGTFCSKTRYTGATKRRILNGDVNWLHGHHSGRAGVAHYDNGWLGNNNNAVDPNDNWVVLCCSRYGVNRYVNGVKKNDNKNGNGDTKNVYINTGPHHTETSDWGGKYRSCSILCMIDMNKF